MAKTYRPSDSDELRRDLQNASPNDTLILKTGTYYLDRIYSFDRLTIQGGDDDATKTILRPKEGRAFRCQGGSTFKNFMSQGGGSVIEAEGHATTIENYIAYGANIPVKLAGDDHVFDGGLIVEADRTGIEVNGGFYLIDELSDRPFRLKKEIGLLNGQQPSQEWHDGQKAFFEDLFYHRNMNTTIKNVVGVRCGKAGGTMYGGFIKCVPNAGGVTLQDNVGIENLIDFWNDFPSDQEIFVLNNTSIRPYKHAIFLEGYVGETAKASVYKNLVIGAERGLFFSAFPEAKSWNNTVFFEKIGKVVHGLTGNRTNKKTGSFTPAGSIPDKLISLGSEYYKAHQVAAQSANYDFSGDELYQLATLDDGPYRINAPENAYRPETKIDVPIYNGSLPTEEELLSRIPGEYQLPDVVAILKQQSYTVNLGGGNPTPTPTPDPDPEPVPVPEVDKFKAALNDLVSDIVKAKDDFNEAV